MAPPLVKGRALLRRRLAGVVFLVVLGLLVQLTVALYQKKFTETVDVALETNRIGNQLQVHSDVKVRGVLVGEVKEVSSNGSRARLVLALDPDRVGQVPRNVRAQLLPKTLFGEKEVQLVIPDDASSEHLQDGDVITQDRTKAALETEKALNDLLPLLRSLEPQQLSTTLNALADGLRGRGDRLGQSFASQEAYFRQLNPSLPTLAQDMQGLADLSGTYADATPDIVRTLDNLAFSGRSLVQEKADLDRFLQSTKGFADSAESIVRENQQRFIDLARDSTPSLDLYAAYSDTYPCMLNRIAFSEIEGERTFGGGQPGLHITVEYVQDHGTYVPGDEPKYKESYNAHCYGLGKKPIIPFPAYRNPQDGYRDSDPPESPGTGPKGTEPAWVRPLTDPPAPVARTAAMPAGTSVLDALLIAPLA